MESHGDHAVKVLKPESLILDNHRYEFTMDKTHLLVLAEKLRRKMYPWLMEAEHLSFDYTAKSCLYAEKLGERARQESFLQHQHELDKEIILRMLLGELDNEEILRILLLALRGRGIVALLR